MSINVRNDTSIHGLLFNNNIITLSQLADDTTIFLSDYQSIDRVLHLLHHFQKCAGLKLNKNKTEAIKLGQEKLDNNKNKHGIQWV